MKTLEYILKSFIRYFLIPAVILLLAACGGAKPESGRAQKLQIITTLFPQYDFARQIVKDKAEVTLLLPSGTEPHMYDPKPSDIVKIANADLFLYTGDDMEPWAAKILSSAGNQKLTAVDLSKNIQLKEPDASHEMLEDEDEHAGGQGHAHTYDPHIWLDLSNAVTMTDDILAALCQKDPDNAAYYRENAEKYKNDLKALDEEYKKTTATAKGKTIVFGGKFAYFYLVTAYDINYVTAYDSCSAESEPSVRRISEIIQFAKDNQIKAVYHEELSDPKIARSISQSCKAKLLLLHTCHNLSREDFEKGVTFTDLMKMNLENLKEGLK